MLSGWILPKQESSWAPQGTWTNIDLDVTPLARRTWNSLTMLSYWASDVISIQSWETGSTILAVGLTWREAILSIVLGSSVMALPMSLNGYTGARTHVPFPVLARASFGYHLAKFPVIVRLVTALFWHAITNFLGVAPMTQIIRAIWPSYRDIPNHIPESVGITTQQMISYLVLWLVQFPLLMIPPHRLRVLFAVKVVMCTATIVGMVVWVCVRAGGSGEIWQQRATVSGSEKSWLTMWAITGCTASWSTVGVNIPDFTRYMRTPRSSLSQGLWFPLICSWVAIMGIVVTSATQVVYGTYIWDPIAVIDRWEGPGGRAAAFFAGVSWCLAQICVNMSATVISGANDLASLFPKWINLRRGAIVLTVLGGWVMVPWKIVHSAGSLLNFMNSLGVFLAPIMGIQVADFFLVKQQHIDVPALYQPHDRYRFHSGINWRALVALVVSITPQLPGLARVVNPDLDIGGAVYLADMNWYYGIVSSLVTYTLLSLCWPARETLVAKMIETDSEGTIVETVEGK
ncbi:permease for cytosine/purines, uracil, thiamine, allantoin-domain-containing protein [Aspergillus granulosus]|uniref:Permease for cytosine/purines, uracil, thiamine, allantoin-domain-containing protein n=1 Tax=Aspergillus granulosus TaxID=176169 RepID=A0ABR4HRA1_9EURO